MVQIAVDAGLRFTYLRDVFEIEALDQDTIVADLVGEEVGGALRLGHRLLTDFRHLVLAVDRRSGRHVGLLGAQDGAIHGPAGAEEFLSLDLGFVAEAARETHLMQKMVALTMLRVAGLKPVPRVLAACTSDPHLYLVLRSLARRFDGSTFFPQPWPDPLPLATAKLARQIAGQLGSHCRFETQTGALRGGKTRDGIGLLERATLSDDPVIDALFGQTLHAVDEVLTVIDLRAMSEDAVTEAARQVYRAR